MTIKDGPRPLPTRETVSVCCHLCPFTIQHTDDTAFTALIFLRRRLIEHYKDLHPEYHDVIDGRGWRG